jgi:hypothetical protein
LSHGARRAGLRRRSHHIWLPDDADHSLESGRTIVHLCSRQASRTHSFRHIYQPQASETDARHPMGQIQIPPASYGYSQTTAEITNPAARISGFWVPVHGGAQKSRLQVKMIL